MKLALTRNEIHAVAYKPTTDRPLRRIFPSTPYPILMKNQSRVEVEYVAGLFRRAAMRKKLRIDNTAVEYVKAQKQAGISPKLTDVARLLEGSRATRFRRAAKIIRGTSSCQG